MAGDAGAGGARRLAGDRGRVVASIAHALGRAAPRGLSYVDRELLASVIVRGETIDQLSRRHGVHRATAARWVGRAHAALDDGLRRELAAALALSPAEVSSVLAAIATSVELTPARLADARPGRRPR